MNDNNESIVEVMSLPSGDRDRAIVKFLCTHPWAIMPTALETIVNVVADHIEGKSIAIGASSHSKIISHTKYPNVAIVNIHGTIAKRLYGLEAISGGKTTIDIQSEIQAALENPNIDAIVLNVDSPGGTVDGTKELADFVREATAQKPIVAYADGLMASAAYWIGSAANKIVAFDTSQVGSIGVIVTHYDQSEKLKQNGVIATHIYAGKYKAYGNSTEPLATEAKEYIQSRVDYYYSLFVDSVAAHRAVDAKTVVESMAEGKIFIGRQAKIAGLIDEVGNIETAIRLALSELEGGTEIMNAEQMKKMSRADALALFVESHGPVSIDEAAAMTAPVPVAKLDPAVQSQLDEMQARLDKSDAEKEEAKQKLIDKELAESAAAKHATVISALTSFSLQDNEGLVALGEMLTDDQFQIIVGVVDLMHNKVKVLSEKLGIETEGAHSEESNHEGVTDQDSAVSFIQERDKIEDVDEAVALAAIEFPQYFKQG